MVAREELQPQEGVASLFKSVTIFTYAFHSSGENSCISQNKHMWFITQSIPCHFKTIGKM